MMRNPPPFARWNAAKASTRMAQNKKGYPAKDYSP